MTYCECGHSNSSHELTPTGGCRRCVCQEFRMKEFDGFTTTKLKSIGTDAYGRNVVKEVNMRRKIKQILKYAAFFIAGSAAAGWAISEESHRDE